MTDLPLTKLADGPTTITLGWTPVPCVGYVLYIAGKRTSNSWDPGKSSWKMGKVPGPAGLVDPQVRIVALGTAAEGTWPAAAPAPVFGTGLPARQRESVVTPIETTTLGSLRQQIGSSASLRIKHTAPLDLGGQDLVINVSGTAQIPITIDLAAPVSNGRILISRAAYLNLRFTDIGHGLDGIKLTDGSHHIDVDGKGGRIHDTGRAGQLGQGILQTDAACHDWQFWNIRLDNNGSEQNGNKDHGVYIAAARGACVLGNLIVTNPAAYGYQFYPDTQDLISTGCESHGTRFNRGGYVIGNEPGEVTSNVRVYGPVVSSAANAVDSYGTPAGCHIYDGVSINNQAGFQIANTNCVTAGTPLAAKDHVDPARYAMHPTHDIDGKPFVTADAGARAL